MASVVVVVVMINRCDRTMLAQRLVQSQGKYGFTDVYSRVKLTR